MTFAYPSTGPTTATTDNFPIWTIWASDSSAAAPPVTLSFGPEPAENLQRALARAGLRDVDLDELRDWRGQMTRLGRHLAARLANVEAAAAQRERTRRRRRLLMPPPPPPRRRVRTCGAGSSRSARPPEAL